MSTKKKRTTRKPTAKKTGPKPIPIDFDKLDAILQFSPTRQMCADILGCSVDRIKRRVKEEKGMTFEEYKNSKMSLTKLKLQQKAITAGLSGNNVMLIFCLKNICKWSDQPKEVEDLIEEMDFDGE